MGLFDAYDADPEDLPTFEGAEPGNYEATIANVAEAEDVYKQGTDEKFIVFSYQAEGINYTVDQPFALPRPKPWDETKVEYSNVMEPQAMLNRLGSISRHLENCGIPKSAQKSVEIDDLQDLIGVDGVLTMKKNKKGYVNASKFVMKQPSGAELPTAETVNPELSNW